VELNSKEHHLVRLDASTAEACLLVNETKANGLLTSVSLSCETAESF